jgi:asparagine synthase (glutamine-hydrolysing)
MCGLVGIWHLNQQPVDPRLVQNMTDCIRHRGPDDEGHLIQNNLALGSRRLSIIDLSPAGHMPMPNQDKTVWITYNGEVYNYLELAHTLKSKGHHFRSKTDIEVVLHAYETFGPDCLNSFNGMWSFAIWDQNKQKLFCAVDRFGIKPFHYYFDGQIFVFGSEIKSILLHPDVPKQVNRQTVYDYLALDHINHSEDTFFAGIKRLPAAHYLILDAAGNLSINRWWDIDLNTMPNHAENEQTLIERFAFLLQDSIRLHLRSDVPIGTCLSGGLDSSSIVCLANNLLFNGAQVVNPEVIGRQQKTFSACYDDPSADERRFIETVIQQTQAEKNYVFPDGYKTLWTDMPDFIWHLEEPFSSTSIYAQWNVMRLVSQRGVKVVLDGQGGDELLAGYSKYPAFVLQQLIRDGRFGTFIKEFKAIGALAPPHRVFNLMLISYLILPRWAKTLIADTGWRLKRRAALEVLQKDFRGEFVDRKHALAGESRAEYQQTLSRQLYADITKYILPSLLRYEDRNSMAFSVEARVPFLDYRLVEFVFSLPVDYRMRDGWSKWILRQAMNGKLPEQIRWRRDKMGYATPELAWLQAAQPYMRELFSSHNTRSNNFLNPRQVLTETEAYLNKGSIGSNNIWRWLNLELWMQQFDLD